MNDLAFVCPETHAPLTLADATTLEALRGALASGGARHTGTLPAGFDGAYVTADQSVAYLVVEGIPVVLVGERVEIDGGLS